VLAVNEQHAFIFVMIVEDRLEVCSFTRPAIGMSLANFVNQLKNLWRQTLYIS
jgi:hypothetical protein